jgi:hypothetical protein
VLKIVSYQRVLRAGEFTLSSERLSFVVHTASACRDAMSARPFVDQRKYSYRFRVTIDMLLGEVRSSKAFESLVQQKRE